MTDFTDYKDEYIESLEELDLVDAMHEIAENESIRLLVLDLIKGVERGEPNDLSSAIVNKVTRLIILDADSYAIDKINQDKDEKR